MFIVGNFTELIWMSHREAERYDTYELSSKYSHPLYAQSLTTETIYKYVIEESKVWKRGNLI